MTWGEGSLCFGSRPGPRAVLWLGLILAACADEPPPPPPLPAPPPEETGLERRPIPPSGVHVVAPGDTLSTIAYVYRLDLDALARANGITDVDRLMVGRQLALRWREPPAVSGPPVRAGEARARATAPEPEAAPLRVVVRPRGQGEAAPRQVPASEPSGEATERSEVVPAAPQE